MGSTQKDRDRGGGKRGSEIKNERGRTDRQNWAENRAGHRERGGGGRGGGGGGQDTGRDGVVGVEGEGQTASLSETSAVRVSY